jgi:16S rRNA (cytosine967-C5)-methyltransferase
VSITANQQRTLLRLLAALQPHWRRDRALPSRIQSLLTRERAFGSRDRRLYRELLYTAIRHLPWIEPWLASDPAEAVRRLAWLAADLPATAAFRAAFATGSPADGDPVELIPAWFRPHCPEAFAPAEAAALLRRAPLWLRLQTDAPGAGAVEAEFAARGWTWERSAVLTDALALRTEADVTTTNAWKEGSIEIQDLGSQLILASVGIEPGRRWLDACAGAGGKTLQLARLLGAAGSVDAFDIRASALDELRQRSNRIARSPRHPLNDRGIGTIRILPPASPECALQRLGHLAAFAAPEMDHDRGRDRPRRRAPAHAAGRFQPLGGPGRPARLRDLLAQLAGERGGRGGVSGRARRV